MTFTLGGTEFEGIEKVKSKARTIMNLKENGQELNAKEQAFVRLSLIVDDGYFKASLEL